MRPWLLLLLVCASAAAGGPFEQGAVSDNRFLFILNTTSGMRRCRAAAEACVAELVSNGIQGRMKAGDTFGLWTFNSKLHAGDFPMQIWTPELNTILGRQVRDFLAKQPYETKAKFDAIAGPLASVARSSRSLLVFLITDGGEPVKGTPFDRALNDAITKNYKALKALHLPFVIVMGVEEGQYVDIKLNSTVNIVMPEVARIPLNPPAPAAATNTAAALAERPQKIVPSAPPPTAPAGIETAGSARGQSDPSPVRPTHAPQPFPAAPEPKAAEPSDASPVAAPVTPPQVVLTPPAEPKLAEASPAAPQTVIQPAAPAAAEAGPSPRPQPTGAVPLPGANSPSFSGRAVENNETPAKTPVTITLAQTPLPPAAENGAILLWAAGGFVFASISLLWILLRGPKTRPAHSLISRSIDKSKRES